MSRLKKNMTTLMPPRADRPDRGGAYALAACALAIFAATIVMMSGQSWPVVLYHLMVDGGITLLWLGAACGLGAAVLWLMRISLDSRAFVLATCAALGWGIMSLAVLGLGLAGWLDRATAVAILAIGLLALAWRALSFCRATDLPHLLRKVKNPKPADWLWLLTAPIAGIIVVAALVPPGLLWGGEPNGYDVVEYHLQVPREWYELGHIVPLGHNVFSYLPFNVEMHYLLAMELRAGPWAGMYLAQLMHAAMTALTVLAVYGLVRQRGNRLAAIIAAVTAASVPWMTLLAPIAYDEGGLLLWSTLGIGWSILAIGSEHRARFMLLAGGCAGLASGAKLSALPMTLVAIPPAYLLAQWGGVKTGAGLARGLAAFFLSAAITLSPWLIRNLVWARNPLFPELTSVLGPGPFSQVQAQRWDRSLKPRADQLSAGSRFQALWQQVLGDRRYGWVFIPIGVVGIALTWKNRATRLLLVVLAIQVGFWMGFTHLQSRFLVLAIPILAMCIGQVQSRMWPAAAIVAACVSLSVVLFDLRESVSRLAGVLGAEDFRPLFPQDVTDAIDSGRPLALAGDARAFFYQVPSQRLTYRTVFDLDVQQGQSLIDAWTRGAPPDAPTIVSPGELRRFAATYYGVPQYTEPQTEMFVIEPASRR